MSEHDLVDKVREMSPEDRERSAEYAYRRVILYERIYSGLVERDFSNLSIPELTALLNSPDCAERLRLLHRVAVKAVEAASPEDLDE